jgi:hypothetical protein
LAGTARLLPHRFAARFPQFGRIAILQRGAVLRDLVGGIALAERRRGKSNDERGHGETGGPMPARCLHAFLH